jgi:hypothetical protein
MVINILGRISYVALGLVLGVWLVVSGAVL